MTDSYSVAERPELVDHVEPARVSRLLTLALFYYFVTSCDSPPVSVNRVLVEDLVVVQADARCPSERVYQRHGVVGGATCPSRLAERNCAVACGCQHVARSFEDDERAAA